MRKTFSLPPCASIGNAQSQRTPFLREPGKTQGPHPLLPWFPALSPGCLSGMCSPFRKVIWSPRLGGFVVCLEGVPVPCSYPIISYLTGGPSGQFPLARWGDVALKIFSFAPGLCSGEDSGAAWRAVQTGVVDSQLWFSISCISLSCQGSLLPMAEKQCIITCNWLQIILHSLCEPWPMTMWPRLPNGSWALWPHAGFIVGAPGAWNTMTTLSPWGGVGEGNPAKEGHWLIISPTELQSQVQNSYLVELISETENWPSLFPSRRTRWILGL